MLNNLEQDYSLEPDAGTCYPQMTYKKLRDNAAYATTYGKLTF